MHVVDTRISSALRLSTLAACLALAACSSGGGGTIGAGSAGQGGTDPSASAGNGEDPSGPSGSATNGTTSNGATTGASTSGGGGGASGALVFVSAGRLVRLDLATKEEVTVSLPYRTDHLGFNGSRLTLVESPDLYVNTIHVTTYAGGAFSDAKLPELDLTHGYVSGAAQPSSDGNRYAVITRENASLGEPFIDYLNVYDKSMTPIAKYAGFWDPQWVTASIVVAASDSGVALVDVDKSQSGQVGPTLAGVSQIALSPDKKSVAFVQASAIWRIGLDGKGLTQVTRQDSSLGWPSWSPDGKTLALNRGVCSMTTEARIVLVPADGVQIDTAKAPTTGGYTCGRVAWM